MPDARRSVISQLPLRRFPARVVWFSIWQGGDVTEVRDYADSRTASAMSYASGGSPLAGDGEAGFLPAEHSSFEVVDVGEAHFFHYFGGLGASPAGAAVDDVRRRSVER